MFNLTAYKTTQYGGSTATTSYTTNAMNEYTAVGSQSLTYTDAGSLADDGTYLYTYDAHQHLIEVKLKSSSSVVATYTYDALGLGRRIGKVVGSATTRCVHAGVQAIEEYDGTTSTASLRRLYVFGERIDQVVAMEAPDAADIDQDSNTTEVLRFSFHTQLIGSVTQVTAPSGSVAESYEYDPYGKPTIKDGGGSTISASAIGNSYLFTARQLDAETGLYSYRARHYSADLRRFVQRDPLEYVDGPNANLYCSASPIRFIDPAGAKDKESEDSAVGAGASFAVIVAHNVTENDLLVKDAVADALILLAYLSARAKNSTADRGFGPNEDGTPGAAYRHCVFTCLLARHVGPATALEATDAYEDYNDPDDPSNSAYQLVDSYMDKCNNREGIECERSSESCDACCWSKLNDGDLWWRTGQGLKYAGPAGNPTFPGVEWPERRPWYREAVGCHIGRGAIIGSGPPQEL